MFERTHESSLMMRVAAITTSLMVMVLFSAGAAHPHHDDIPDPPPQSTPNRIAPVANIDRTAITVSGLSSGGFFAHQFHIAYSKLVNGSGIVAGGPFACVEGIPNPFFVFCPLDRVSAATVACTNYVSSRYFWLRPSAPKAESSVSFIKDANPEKHGWAFSRRCSALAAPSMTTESAGPRF